MSLDVDEEGCFRPSVREDDFCPAGSLTRETVRDLEWILVSCSGISSMLSMTSSSLVLSSWGLDETGTEGLARELETVSLSLGLGVTISAELTE